jgi:hypothetical protein
MSEFTKPTAVQSDSPIELAKDDTHADRIVQGLREEFDKPNDFAVKITFRTSGRKPEELLAEFRTAYNPRIAVTVDMIATGTDIKPLECVFFSAWCGPYTRPRPSPAGHTPPWRTPLCWRSRGVSAAPLSVLQGSTGRRSRSGRTGRSKWCRSRSRG